MCRSDAADYYDFLFDHKDMINRLSAEEPPDTQAPQMVALPAICLNEEESNLLHLAVVGTRQQFQAAVQKQASAKQNVTKFLSQPNVDQSDVWLTTFESRPPRGVLARLCKRFDAEIHESHGYYQYRNPQEFLDEIDRMHSWYLPGRKTLRRARRSSIRDEADSRLVEGDGMVVFFCAVYNKTWCRSKLCPCFLFNTQKHICEGARTVFNQKMTEHYSKLKTPARVQGLWNWALVSRGMRRAGIPLVSGTLSVEQKWSILKTMLPSQARRVSLEWWQMLSDMTFLRLMYTHYHRGNLPSWTDNDSLLAQKLEGPEFCSSCRARKVPQFQTLTSVTACK